MQLAIPLDLCIYKRHIYRYEMVQSISCNWMAKDERMHMHCSALPSCTLDLHNRAGDIIQNEGKYPTEWQSKPSEHLT